MEYQYKVVSFKAEVTTGDIRKGEAGEKVAKQLEGIFQREARQAQMLLRAYRAVSSIARGLRNTGRRRI